MKDAKKKEEARIKADREEREEKERKRKWEDECVSRMAKSEPPIDYEAWCEEEKKKKEAEEKAKKAKR